MKMRLFFLCFVLFFLFTSARFVAQTPLLGTALDSTKFYIGATFQGEYHLKDITQNQAVNFPNYAVLENTQYEFVRAINDTIKNANTSLDYTQKVQFLALEAGAVELPAFAFVMQQDTIFSEVIALEILPLPIEDPKKLVDIQNIQEVPSTWGDRFWQLWYWLLAHPWFSLSFFVLLLGILCYFGYQQYQAYWVKKALRNAPKPLVPPHIEAFELLEALAQKELWQKGDYKIYYTELSFVLRNYLQRKYLIPALEETSDEIFMHLRKTHFPQEQKENLRKLLALSDLVKFAKEEPLSEANLSAMEQVRAFITLSLQMEEALLQNQFHLNESFDVAKN